MLFECSPSHGHPGIHPEHSAEMGQTRPSVSFGGRCDSRFLGIRHPSRPPCRGCRERVDDEVSRLREERDPSRLLIVSRTIAKHPAPPHPTAATAWLHASFGLSQTRPRVPTVASTSGIPRSAFRPELRTFVSSRLLGSDPVLASRAPRTHSSSTKFLILPFSFTYLSWPYDPPPLPHHTSDLHTSPFGLEAPLPPSRPSLASGSQPKRPPLSRSPFLSTALGSCLSPGALPIRPVPEPESSLQAESAIACSPLKVH